MYIILKIVVSHYNKLNISRYHMCIIVSWDCTTYIIIYGLWWIVSIWSLMRWFANDVYKWCNHEPKSLANHPKSDQIIITHHKPNINLSFNTLTWFKTQWKHWKLPSTRQGFKDLRIQRILFKNVQSTRQIRTPVLRIPHAVTSQAKMKSWLHECQKWVSHMIGQYAHI